MSFRLNAPNIDRALSIYVGDDSTDEDELLALPDGVLFRLRSGQIAQLIAALLIQMRFGCFCVG